VLLQVVVRLRQHAGQEVETHLQEQAAAANAAVSDRSVLDRLCAAPMPTQAAGMSAEAGSSHCCFVMKTLSSCGPHIAFACFLDAAADHTHFKHTDMMQL
jgi:hypothetical protein